MVGKLITKNIFLKIGGVLLTMKCHLMNEFWYEFSNRYTEVCRQHINVNFSVETVLTSK